jgi:hypothetical protein
VPGSVYHVFTNAIQDGTNSSIVRPSDWNSSHALTLNAVGSEVSGAFANGGGISFGLSADGFITAAAPAGAPSPINFSAGTTSGNIGSVVFSNSGGVSFGLNGSTITATVKTDYLTTARASNDAIGLNTALTANGVAWTVNSSGLSLNIPAFLTTARASNDAVGLNTAKTAVTWTVNSSGISIDAGAYLTTARASNDAVGLNTAKTNVTWTVNSSGISLDAGAYLTTAALSTMGLYASSNTYLTSSGTHDARSLSFRGDKNITVGISASEVMFSVGNYLTTARASTDAVGLNTAKTNVTWTVNSSGISLDGGAYLTTQTNQTVGMYATGNTTNSSSTTFDARTLGTINALGAMTAGFSNGSIQISAPATSSLVGTFGISVSSNGSTISVQPVFQSFYQNDALVNSSAMTWNGASVSHVVGFYVPAPMSFSFLRLPALMTTNSTTLATMASATASAQGHIVSTLNAVIYSLGVGANSQSLQSVASASAGYTMSHKISVTNSTQGSYTLAVSQQAAGGGTSLSTQYSVSNTNYSFTTDQIATNFSSARYLDIPFASSLTPGQYWLVVGLSSTSTTAGAAGLTNLTNCNVRYSAHYGNSQADLSFGVMGSTNRTSNPWNFAGSFSTAGGGTTNSIPISAISSIASMAFPVFQLARSA